MADKSYCSLKCYIYIYDLLLLRERERNENMIYDVSVQQRGALLKSFHGSTEDRTLHAHTND